MEKIFIDPWGHILKKGKKQTGPVLKLLGKPIELDKEFTLKSFFLMLDHYPELKQISEILDSLLTIISGKGGIEGKTSEIETLVFYKTIEIHGFPGKPKLTVYNSLKGVVNKKAEDLKFFHPETLMDHTLTLGKLNHIVFGDKEDIFRYETFYTLFELVEGIAWELSFNFNPLQCSIRR
ncbi:MAG: hypothetical protein A2097_09795 [Desulfobacula sp. GWF2_41_7]|nr:MAG: hypothetical protein A2097_09795 [Desulfobacula sp. GWF2_41_7]